MSGKGLWGMKTLCVVTGGSQGIGRTLAVEFSKKLAPGSTVLLLARSVTGLNGTKDLIQGDTKDITVLVESVDMSAADMSVYSDLMKRCTQQKFDSYLLVHNAGSEGNGRLTSQMSDLHEWHRYMNLNLFSLTLLTSAFLSETPPPPCSENVCKTVINITSLCGVQPVSGLGYYCVGKSSREMYLRTLALENPDLRVLSYSPGPVDTTMINRVIDSLKVDQTRDMFKSMKEDLKLLTPLQTVTRLVDILAEGSFTSGQRIDYFDKE